MQGATRNPPGWRTTPPGKAQCEHEGAGAHQEFPQYVLGSMGADLAADDFLSDDAPLRQLEVTSVHPTRAEYAWGPTTAQRAVLVYMCTSDAEDVRDLTQSLAAIESSFVQHYDYPVAIFHEDYDRALMERVQAAAPLVFIYFVRIRFQLPKHLRPLEADGVRTVRHVIPNPEHPTGFHEHEHGLRPYVKRANKYPYGYQHMCRFFSGAGFMLPFFDAFDWYVRPRAHTRTRECAALRYTLLGSAVRRRRVGDAARIEASRTVFRVVTDRCLLCSDPSVCLLALQVLAS